jgi:hypothetical protein
MPRVLSANRLVPIFITTVFFFSIIFFSCCICHFHFSQYMRKVGNNHVSGKILGRICLAYSAHLTKCRRGIANHAANLAPRSFTACAPSGGIIYKRVRATRPVSSCVQEISREPRHLLLRIL